MNEPSKKSVAYTNYGDHHLGKIDYNPATGQVSAGFIYGFSDNAAASVQLINGHTTGTIMHNGENHSMKLNDDGTFDGTYEDKNGNISIKIQGGTATLLSGQIPSAGISLLGDHHTITLKMDEYHQLTGSLEAKDSKNGSYKLSIDKNKVTGSVVCYGVNHNLSFDVSSDGRYKSSLSFGPDGSALSVSVENGTGGVTVHAGLRLDF
jgi:hypothetical protein